MSAGSTPDEARTALDEAVHLFLMTVTDMGTLDDILQETGYDQQERNWVIPVWVAIERRATEIGVS